MSDIVMAMGVPVAEFQFDGKTYHVHQFTNEVLAKISVLAKNHFDEKFKADLATLTTCREAMSQELYDREVSDLYHAHKARSYHLGSDQFMEYMGVASLKMLELVTDASQDVLFAMLQSPQRDTLLGAFKAAKEVSLGGGKEAAARPKVKAVKRDRRRK